MSYIVIANRNMCACTCDCDACGGRGCERGSYMDGGGSMKCSRLLLLVLVAAAICTMGGVASAVNEGNATEATEVCCGVDKDLSMVKDDLTRGTAITIEGVDKETIKKMSSILIEKIGSVASDEELPVIIMFTMQDRPSAKIEAQDTVVSKVESYNGKVGYRYNLIDAVSAKMPAGKIAEIAESPVVERIWYDEVYQLPPAPDPNESMQMDVSTQAIGANYVWETLGYTGSGITVAVVVASTRS